MTKNIFGETTSKIAKIIKDNIFLVIVIIAVVVGVVGTSMYSSYLGGENITEGGKILTAQAAGEKTINYINEKILMGQGRVSLKEIQEVSGMYKIKIDFEIESQVQDSDAYLTKDGRYLFPVMQGIPMDLDEVFTFQESEEEYWQEPSDLTSVSTESIAEFVGCLKNMGFIIYGANWCGYTKQLVEMFGGWDAADPVYVECTEEASLCQEKNIRGYPTILIQGEEYQGQRSFQGFEQATGCGVPEGMESSSQPVASGGGC